VLCADVVEVDREMKALEQDGRIPDTQWTLDKADYLTRNMTVL